MPKFETLRFYLVCGIDHWNDYLIISIAIRLLGSTLFSGIIYLPGTTNNIHTTYKKLTKSLIYKWLH